MCISPSFGAEWCKIFNQTSDRDRGKILNLILKIAFWE